MTGKLQWSWIENKEESWKLKIEMDERNRWKKVGSTMNGWKVSRLTRRRAGASVSVRTLHTIDHFIF